MERKVDKVPAQNSHGNTKKMLAYRGEGQGYYVLHNFWNSCLETYPDSFIHIQRRVLGMFSTASAGDEQQLKTCNQNNLPSILAA